MIDLWNIRNQKGKEFEKKKKNVNVDDLDQEIKDHLQRPIKTRNSFNNTLFFSMLPIVIFYTFFLLKFGFRRVKSQESKLKRGKLLKAYLKD